jgi:hypothetical protein
MIFFFNLADFSYLKEERKKRRLLDMVRTGKNGPFLKWMQMVSDIFQ